MRPSPKTRTLVALAMLMAPATTAVAQETPAAPKLPLPVINETLTIPYQSVPVLDSEMAYLDIGEGKPVLFIHGNPTSAYLWRNIIPYVADNHRAIAVDLIGMGRSGRPDIGYTFADHYRYIDAFVETLDLPSVTLVGHDWGAALSWEYARHHPDQVTALAFMEGVVPPALPFPTYETMGEEAGNMFRAFRDPDMGHQLVIKENMFVEQVLPGFINRPLGAEAMAVYRAPYVEEAARTPTLVWPRELPIENEPPETVALMGDIAGFMATTDMPVLLAYAEPGALVPPQVVDWYVNQIANLETAYIGQGLHFIQEDQPDAIGRALADWLRRN